MANFLKFLPILILIESFICIASSSVLLINDSESNGEEYDKNDPLLRENRYRKLADEDLPSIENLQDLFGDNPDEDYDFDHEELNEIDLLDDLNDFDVLKKENYKHLIDLIQSIAKASNKEQFTKSKLYLKTNFI